MICNPIVLPPFAPSCHRQISYQRLPSPVVTSLPAVTSPPPLNMSALVTQCPLGSQPNSEGNDCTECSAGTYNLDGAECLPCPQGVLG